jgi:hypothetical protein
MKGLSMAQAPVSQKVPPIRNDDDVPEHFVDGPVGVNFYNGNLHVTFATLRCDHASEPATQYRQVTLRLVISLPGVFDLQNNLAGIISLLQKQGAIQQITQGPQTRQ